jgi:hypothetical protein
MNNFQCQNEPTSIGLSEKSHTLLKRLKDDGHFAEMAHAYRFGVALALAHGVLPDEPVPPKATIFSVATIDPDREIALAVHTILGDEIEDMPVYRVVERLAEWGVRELSRKATEGEIDFAGLLAEVDRLTEGHDV